MKRDSAPVSHDVLGIQVILLNSIKLLRRGERHLQIGLMTKDEAGQVPRSASRRVRDSERASTTASEQILGESPRKGFVKRTTKWGRLHQMRNETT